MKRMIALLLVAALTLCLSGSLAETVDHPEQGIRCEMSEDHWGSAD